ncbi:cation-translocating P-type ATPase [Polaromonas sp. A23]|uniref:heavy metal translocating P-type ATPase n=1 Tax=Polaromonas sp. A23 TaxID=1944133 RepID=UPI000986FA1D|nr:cation-translocating P-type ATPase [Polaromonas sp. A23]OOG36720.1 ATPase P [Polaromonas sp. A23]
MQTATLLVDSGAALQASRWSALDERAEWEGFSRPLTGRPGFWESYLAIEGMHCAACSLTVEEVLQNLPGVESVQVNGASAVARVAWTPERGRPSAWLAALQRAGYGALPAGDMLAASPRIQAQRMMLWRWLVAGFCMMQVMMYAFPAYIAEAGDISAEAQGLLRWASWVLTLPVVLFSCWPFFLAALRDLRNRRIGMDVPVALGILIAFGASSAATFDPASRWGAEVWYDSITMFVFFLLSGRLLEQRLRDRTAGSLEALMRSLPDSVERQGADGVFERVPVRRLVPGDLIRLLPGDVVPADGTVAAGESQVDEALLTGESTPLQRRIGSAVIAGSHNLNGMLLVRVERAGSETRYAAIVALMEQASVQKPRLARIADRIAGPFVLLVLLASAAAAFWWWPSDPAHAIGVAVAVLIVTCPCALSLATPAATLAAAGALARRGVLVRRLEALESCAAVDTVVFDKTGTLTEDRMTVAVSRTREGLDPSQALLMAVALAQHSLHPLSRAIVQAAGTVPGSATDVTEVPGQGLQGHVACGASGQQRFMRLGSATFCGMPVPVHASNGPQVHLADEAGWLASFDMDEALRPEASSSVGALQTLGLQVQLLSGDLMAAVARLASRAGIDEAYGQHTPEAKLAHVRRLQQSGRHVAMVGDGMNDGPVLACADVSVAMGQAVPLAQAKSDFVVLGGQLAAVAALLRHARRTRAIVRQNLWWAALYNAVCVPLAVLGFMPPWLAGLGMAASSLLVVLNSARLARMPEAF